MELRKCVTLTTYSTHTCTYICNDRESMSRSNAVGRYQILDGHKLSETKDIGWARDPVSPSSYIPCRTTFYEEKKEYFEKA